MAAVIKVNVPVPTSVPNGFKWSAKAAEKAVERRYFIRVGGKSATKRYISGAERAWKKTKPDEYNSVFSLETRLTGTPDNIATALQYAGYTSSDITSFLGNAITRENFQTSPFAELYQDEKSAHLTCKKDPKTCPEQGYELDTLHWFIQNLAVAKCVNKTGETKCEIKKGKTGPAKSLAERIKLLGPQDLLDVSNMDEFTGKGVTKTKKKTQTRTGKYFVGNVPFLSNNLTKYISALKIAYGEKGPDMYRNEVEELGKLLSQRAESFVPKTIPVPAPAPVPASLQPKLPTPRRLAGVAPTTTASRIPPTLSSPPRGVGVRGGSGVPPMAPFSKKQ